MRNHLHKEDFQESMFKGDLFSKVTKARKTSAPVTSSVISAHGFQRFRGAAVADPYVFAVAVAVALAAFAFASS
jgi:hypothetical protein